MISLIIFGTRSCYPSYEEIEAGISDLGLNTKWGPNKIDSVCCGLAKGADAAGKMWAQDNNIKIIYFYARWGEFGSSAGPIRNKQMADFATHGLGFWHNNSRGTANMAAHMLLQHKPVKLYECEKFDIDSDNEY